MSKRGSARWSPRISPTTCPHQAFLLPERVLPEVQPMTNGPPCGRNVTLDPKWSTRSTNGWSGASASPVVSVTHARPRGSSERNRTVRTVVRRAAAPRCFSADGTASAGEPSESRARGLESPHAEARSRTAVAATAATEGKGSPRCPVPPSRTLGNIATRSNPTGERRCSWCRRDRSGSRCSYRTPRPSPR